MGERRSLYRVLVVKPRGKRPLGRPRRRWGNNTKMALQEVAEDKDWIDVAQDGMVASASECGEFLHLLRTCQFLKKDTAPCS
jgi:hypothetical protein